MPPPPSSPPEEAGTNKRPMPEMTDTLEAQAKVLKSADEDIGDAIVRQQNAMKEQEEALKTTKKIEKDLKRAQVLNEKAKSLIPSEVKAIEEHYMELARRHSEAGARSSELELKIEQKQEEIDKLKKEIAEQMGSADDELETRDSSDSNIDRLTEEINAKNNKIATLKEELAQSQQENEGNQATLTRLQEEYEQYNASSVAELLRAVKKQSFDQALEQEKHKEELEATMVRLQISIQKGAKAEAMVKRVVCGVQKETNVFLKELNTDVLQIKAKDFKFKGILGVYISEDVRNALSPMEKGGPSAREKWDKVVKWLQENDLYFNQKGYQDNYKTESGEKNNKVGFACDLVRNSQDKILTGETELKDAGYGWLIERIRTDLNKMSKEDKAGRTSSRSRINQRSSRSIDRH